MFILTQVFVQLLISQVNFPDSPRISDWLCSINLTLTESYPE